MSGPGFVCLFLKTYTYLSPTHSSDVMMRIMLFCCIHFDCEDKFSFSYAANLLLTSSQLITLKKAVM